MESFIRRGIKLTVTGIIVGFLSLSTVYADEGVVEEPIQSETVEAVQPIQVVGYSTGNHVNIRVAPNTSCQVLGQVNLQDPLLLQGKQGNWYQIFYNGQVAWIFGDYVGSAELASVPEIEPVIAPVMNGDKAQEIIQFAKQYIGTPYRYAGTALGKGVDCSGFTYSVMNHFGISLNRSSRDQVYNGRYVDKSQLQPGDLIFFDTNGGANRGNISHVGLYIGEGNFIHSATNKGVVINNLYESYYVRTYVKASRIL